MNELRAVVEAASKARDAGKPVILATVVRVQGSAYRKPGARMLLTEEGWQAGCVSGGCLEADILRRAWWCTRSGDPIVVTYDSRAVDDEELSEELSHGFGLGCNGVVDILLERIAPDDGATPIDFIASCLQSRESGAMATIISETESSSVGQRLYLKGAADVAAGDRVELDDLTRRLAGLCGDALAAGRSRNVQLPTEEGKSVEVFIEVIHPPMPLLICGAGHDAAPLARMAAELGWAVTVVDPRAGTPARPERFPGAERVISCAPAQLTQRVTIDSRTAAVVMSHNTAFDADLLAALLPSPARYIGVLGPRHRTERLLEVTGSVFEKIDGLDRVFGPVGVDIGAETPEAIALSILAEIQAVVSGRRAGHLRDQTLPNRSLVTEPKSLDVDDRMPPIPLQEFATCPLSTVPVPHPAMA